MHTDNFETEFMYNFKDICTAVFNKNHECAIEIYDKRTEEIIKKGLLQDNRGIHVFLNYLNYSLYCFILYTTNKSCHTCCKRNQKFISICKNLDDIFSAGHTIIKSYCSNPSDSKPSNPYIKEIIAYINANFKSNISLDDLAEEIHLNKYYLSQMFHSCVGMNISKYINLCRLEEAKKLLLETGFKIHYISEISGFQSATYFTTMFKREFGVTPKEFREKNNSSFTAVLNNKNSGPD